MLKNFAKVLLLLLVFAIPSQVKASGYFGAGPLLAVPMADVSDVNEQAIGMTMHYEMRQICQFWYGLRLDYFSMNEVEDLGPTEDYFSDVLNFSPTVRYNFLGSNCRDYNIVPYAQAMATFSSIENSDDLSRLGVGAGAGLGVAYSFSVFNLCWMIDLNGIYSAPNVIYREEGRDMFQSMNVSLTLSIRL